LTILIKCSTWLKCICIVKWFILGSFYILYKSIQDFLHGCYFKNYYYFNIWIIYIQSPTKFPKFMWKLVFNVVDVILKFGSCKRITHKVHKKQCPIQNFQNHIFWDKKIEKETKIATHMDLWKYCQILTIQKSLVIKWLRFF